MNQVDRIISLRILVTLIQTPFKESSGKLDKIKATGMRNPVRVKFITVGGIVLPTPLNAHEYLLWKDKEEKC